MSPKNKIKRIYWLSVAVISISMILIVPISAETVWERFSFIMQDFYGELVAISTIAGVTAAAVALIIRMVSRNQRAVDEASAWLKRIIITWLILNSLGFIVAYVQPLVAGGQYSAI